MHTCIKAKVRVKAKERPTHLAKAPRIPQVKDHLIQLALLIHQGLLVLPDSRIVILIKAFLRVGSPNGVPLMVDTTMSILTPASVRGIVLELHRQQTHASDFPQAGSLNGMPPTSAGSTSTPILGFVSGTAPMRRDLCHRRSCNRPGRLGRGSSSRGRR